MPNPDVCADVPYYYDFDGSNNAYLQQHVDTVLRQAGDIRNKKSLKYYLQKYFNEFQSDFNKKEAIANQEQLSLIKSGAEFILKVFKDFPCHLFKVEKALIQDWLVDYRNRLYGICLQRNFGEVQLKEYISKVAHYHLNTVRHETCSINITRTLQYTKEVAIRQLPPRGDDLNIDKIIREFKDDEMNQIMQSEYLLNGHSPARGHEEGSVDHSRYVLFQHLRHHIHNYINNKSSMFFHMDRNTDVRSATAPFSVFDLLKFYGYECLLHGEENGLGLTHEETRIRDSMAMQFVNIPHFADNVISACNKHVDLIQKRRMPYTQNLG